MFKEEMGVRVFPSLCMYSMSWIYTAMISLWACRKVSIRQPKQINSRTNTLLNHQCHDGVHLGHITQASKVNLIFETEWPAGVSSSSFGGVLYNTIICGYSNFSRFKVWWALILLSTCIPTDSFVLHIFVGTFFTNNSSHMYLDLFLQLLMTLILV